MAIQNKLQKSSKEMTFSDYLSSPKIIQKSKLILGEERYQSFITSIVAAVSSNPDLATCDQHTIYSAAITGVSHKLSPSPQLGYFYMVPYFDNKNNRRVCQFQMGYKGYIQLAIRSGYYKALNVIAIKKGELIHFDPLTEELKLNIIEDQYKREAAETVAYCGYFEYVNGFSKKLLWSHEKMLNHADTYSKAFDKNVYMKMMKGETIKNAWKYSSNWYKDFEGMATKTMLRQILSKWGIMSIELQDAYIKDMAVVSEGNVDYIDGVEFSDSILGTSTPGVGETDQTPVYEEEEYSQDADDNKKGKSRRKKVANSPVNDDDVFIEHSAVLADEAVDIIKSVSQGSDVDNIKEELLSIQKAIDFGKLTEQDQKRVRSSLEEAGNITE